jgi:hypothetical protein
MSKLDRDLIKHASEKLAAAARRRVREGAEPASAARTAIRETQALFPHDWRLGVQGDDGDDVVEVWEVEHRAAEPIAVVSREAARKGRSAKRSHATKSRGSSIDTAQTLVHKFRGRERNALVLAEIARQALGAAKRWDKRSSAHAAVGEFREADDADTESRSLRQLADQIEQKISLLRRR